MKKFKFIIKGHEYEVDIISFDQNVVELEVNGTPYAVEVKREVKTTKTPVLVRPPEPKPSPMESTIARAPESARAIKTPLPGIVMKILVREGDRFRRGDTLLVMEAMKMENNINADKDGRVLALKVKPGDNVLQNDVLMLVE